MVWLFSERCNGKINRDLRVDYFDLPFICSWLMNMFQGGAQQVSELLAKHVGKENVRLGEPVSAVQQVIYA